MTNPGVWHWALDGLPSDLSSLCRVVQGLLLHEQRAKAYEVEITREQSTQTHCRKVEEALAQIVGQDERSLEISREPAARFVGVCRHFAVMLCAMLRHQGVPARARCGFGAYFENDRYVDHWVCEYWNTTKQRWTLVDAQIDSLQKRVLKPAFDLLDVPRDEFIVAGEAWRQCRRGDADPKKFGIFNESGLWFISGNVLRDFAALNKVEMLPWDVWGTMYGPDVEPSREQLALLDQLAELSLDNFDGLTEIHACYDEPEVRVPEAVFNAVRGRNEAV